MLKSIKREFLLNRNSLWQSLAVLGGAWLLGEALSLCIMYFAHEEEYFSLGTVFAAIMLVMFGVIFALYYFSCGYEQALTMSCTRRRFLFGMFVTVCLQLLCLVGGIVVLTLLDRCCFSKRMRKVFKKNEKSMLQFCNKNSKKKGVYNGLKSPCKRPFSVFKIN